jgi:hypothetical protein
MEDEKEHPKGRDNFDCPKLCGNKIFFMVYFTTLSASRLCRAKKKE